MAARTLAALGASIPVAVLVCLSGLGSLGAEARERVPVVVELFTSEGCVNCPPADELLRELADTQPIPAAHIVVLGLHVDYWNRLGWSDRFSSADFTRRQEAYARAAHASSVYTPQAIVDGHLALVGHNRAAVFDSIRRAAGTEKTPIALTWLSQGDVSRLAVELPAGPAAAGADVFLAVVESDLATDVVRGENGGRTLRHAPVTRSLTRLGRAGEDGGFRTTAYVDWRPEWSPALQVVAFAQHEAARVLAVGMIDR